MTHVQAMHRLRVLAHTRVWYLCVMLLVTRVTRTRLLSCIWAVLYIARAPLDIVEINCLITTVRVCWRMQMCIYNIVSTTGFVLHCFVTVVVFKINSNSKILNIWVRVPTLLLHLAISTHICKLWKSAVVKWGQPSAQKGPRHLLSVQLAGVLSNQGPSC